jgi:hypothetical protein
MNIRIIPEGGYLETLLSKPLNSVGGAGTAASVKKYSFHSLPQISTLTLGLNGKR